MSSNLFLKLADTDINGYSRLVSTAEFINKYSSLILGNGGSWCRFDGSFAKSYKMITIKQNGIIRYSWNLSELKNDVINKDIDKMKNNNEIKITNGISIKYIKLYGIQKNDIYRPISAKIRKYFTGMKCVVCGSGNDTVIDHKNGLYNDNRVLSTTTQTIDDFQVLCNHCNLQKRQVIITMKNTNKKYSALNIPSIAIYKIAFIYGDENYDINDPNWGIGTYWHDPCEFMRNIKEQLLINYVQIEKVPIIDTNTNDTNSIINKISKIKIID